MRKFRLFKKRKKRRVKNEEYRTRTLYIFPFICKVGLFLFSIYLMYFIHGWLYEGLPPYTLGYTLYVSDAEYSEYGIGLNEVLIISENIEKGTKEDLYLHRVGDSKYVLNNLKEGSIGRYIDIDFNVMK